MSVVHGSVCSSDTCQQFALCAQLTCTVAMTETNLELALELCRCSMIEVFCCLAMQDGVLAIKLAADELTAAASALVEAEKRVADLAESQV